MPVAVAAMAAAVAADAVASAAAAAAEVAVVVEGRTGLTNACSDPMELRCCLLILARGERGVGAVDRSGRSKGTDGYLCQHAANAPERERQNTTTPTFP